MLSPPTSRQTQPGKPPSVLAPQDCSHQSFHPCSCQSHKGYRIFRASLTSGVSAACGSPLPFSGLIAYPTPCLEIFSLVSATHGLASVNFPILNLISECPLCFLVLMENYLSCKDSASPSASQGVALLLPVVLVFLSLEWEEPLLLLSVTVCPPPWKHPHLEAMSSDKTTCSLAFGSH